MPGEQWIADRYRLAGVLRSDGLGTLWRADDVEAGRTVTIRPVDLGGVAEDQRASRTTLILKEVGILIRVLTHQHIVSIVDAVDHEGRPWIVSELVEGRSLYDTVTADGPLTVERTAEVGLCAVTALAEALRFGIPHGGVNPWTVLLPDAGGAMLSDFGAGRMLSNRFSLGSTLYFALEGLGPFEASDPLAAAYAVATLSPSPPARAGHLAGILNGLLEKDLRNRATLEQARAELAGSLGPAAPA